MKKVIVLRKTEDTTLFNATAGKVRTSMQQKKKPSKHGKERSSSKFEPKPFIAYVSPRFAKLLKKQDLIREDGTVLMWGQPFNISVLKNQKQNFQCFWPKFGYGKPPWEGKASGEMPPEVKDE